MRRTCIPGAMLMLLATLSWAEAPSVERPLSGLAETLASAFAGEQPPSFRINISIGQVEDRSPAAAGLRMGEAVRELLLGIFSRSNVFAVIERDKLDLILEEQELQLSDVVDEASAVEIGGILSAQAILYGAITELGDSFLISATIVDVETGRSVTEQVPVEKAALSAEAERRLDMMYVQPMGIGISVAGLGVTRSGNSPSLSPFPVADATNFRRTLSLEVRYRLSRRFMAAVGVDYAYGQLVHYDTQHWDLQPVYTSGAPWIGDAPFDIVGTGLGVPLRLTFSVSPLRWLNLFVAGGAELFLLTCAGYFEPSNGNGFGVNDFGPTVETTFFSFSGMAGAEAFLTPRLAVSLAAGYDYGRAELDTAPMWHLTDLPSSVTADVGGLRLEARITAYF